jgi:hypothetical protein
VAKGEAGDSMHEETARKDVEPPRIGLSCLRSRIKLYRGLLSYHQVGIGNISECAEAGTLAKKVYLPSLFAVPRST